ncbi:hypothetical protein GJ496_007767 [Pomphorhynchus laevis]|nr:hypothetical protein GJ496_007767 [Pomphorhynchus laevis]
MSDSGLQFLVDKQSTADPSLQPKYNNLVSLYQNKLWHQFSESLLDLINQLPLEGSDSLLKELYGNLIKDNLELRISQLMHVEISYAVVTKYTSLDEARDFMMRVKSVVDQRNDKHAKVLVRIILAKIDLVSKEFDKVEDALNKVKPFIADTQPTAQVHGRYYDVASSMYQVKGDHTNFYINALGYLACGTDYLSIEYIRERSFHICLAAILSDDLYDLCEIMQNQIIVNCLKTTKDDWVLQLIQAIGSGDIDTVENLKTNWSIQPDLRAHADWIETKSSILALVAMACDQHNNRTSNSGIVRLSLSEIHKQIGGDAEILCMKVLSLGLLQGSIDQVKSLFTVTWIKPLSLTTVHQLTSLRERLRTWHHTSSNLGQLLLEKAQLSG